MAGESYLNGSLWSLGFSSDPILKSLRNEPSYRMFLSTISYPVQRWQSQMNMGSSAILAEAMRVSGA
jgi:hypothetical protein